MIFIRKTQVVGDVVCVFFLYKLDVKYIIASLNNKSHFLSYMYKILLLQKQFIKLAVKIFNLFLQEVCR